MSGGELYRKIPILSILFDFLLTDHFQGEMTYYSCTHYLFPSNSSISLYHLIYKIRVCPNRSCLWDEDKKSTHKHEPSPPTGTHFALFFFIQGLTALTLPSRVARRRNTSAQCPAVGLPTRTTVPQTLTLFQWAWNSFWRRSSNNKRPPNTRFWSAPMQTLNSTSTGNFSHSLSVFESTYHDPLVSQGINLVRQHLPLERWSQI